MEKWALICLHIESVKSIIKVLFPNAQWALGLNVLHSIDENDFLKLRINHKYCFDRYFLLRLTDDDVTQTEFEQIKENSGNEDVLLNLFMIFYEQNRITTFLAQFDAHKQSIDKSNVEPFMSAMLRLGDRLTDEREGSFDISPLMRVKRIIYWYFNQQDFLNKKELYSRILDQSKAIFLPIELLREELGRTVSSETTFSYVFSGGDDSIKIKEMILEKLHSNSDSEEFRSNIHLPKIVLIWFELEKTNAKKWFTDHIEQDDNFMMFLGNLEQKSRNTFSYESQVTYHISLEIVRMFFDDMDGFFARVHQFRKSGSIKDEKFNRILENLIEIEAQYKDQSSTTEI